MEAKEHDMEENARNATRILSTKSARAALYKMQICFKQIDSNFQNDHIRIKWTQKIR